MAQILHILQLFAAQENLNHPPICDMTLQELSECS